MNDNEQIGAAFKALPLLEKKEGTIFLSHTTVPRSAAWAAMSMLNEKKDVEFIFIGESPSHTAFKTCGVLAELFDQRWTGEFTLLFRPLRYRTYSTAFKREVEAQGWKPQVIDLKLSVK